MAEPRRPTVARQGLEAAGGPADAAPRLNAPAPSPSLHGGVEFYYDLTSPECWLAAERIAGVLPLVPEFVPVLGRALGIEPQPPDRAALAARARELGLLPLRWPKRWPPDGELAALTAIYAAGIGKVAAFSLAAFRQAFAGGRDLGEQDTVLIAAAACEMHPRAVLKACGLRSVADSLRHACERARAAGVRALPAISADGRLFEGEASVEQAAVALAGAAAGGRTGSPGACGRRAPLAVGGR
jgi:2-hydroxychromene-2-carboxylate isomerase